MLKANAVTGLKKWFADYVKTFLGDDSEVNRNIILKEEHTYRVCHEIIAVAESLCLDEHLSMIAEITALLHDIGRFEQYSRYNTFVDKHSENHAQLGLKVIARLRLLEDLSATDAAMVCTAIANHNLAAISSDICGETLTLCRLIRDADKLDIWKVVTDYYEQGPEKRNTAIELGLPPDGEVSPEVFNSLRQRQIIKSGDLRNLNDFKILQLAWVYDLNFSHSLKEFERRGYLQKITGSISDKKRACVAEKLIKGFIKETMAS